jgi:hypothetical protein
MPVTSLTDQASNVVDGVAIAGPFVRVVVVFDNETASPAAKSAFEILLTGQLNN